MINKKWFIRKLEEREKSLRALARYMNIDPSAVTHMFNNERRMQLNEAELIAQFLMVPIDDVLRNAGVKLQGSGSHIGKLIGIVDDTGEVHPLPPVAIPAPSAGLHALQVQPSFMLFDGAILFFKEGGSIKPELCVNRMAIIDQGDHKRVGILQRGTAPDRYTIRTLTTELRFQPVQCATPIAWIKP